MAQVHTSDATSTPHTYERVFELLLSTSLSLDPWIVEQVWRVVDVEVPSVLGESGVSRS